MEVHPPGAAAATPHRTAPEQQAVAHGGVRQMDQVRGQQPAGEVGDLRAGAVLLDGGGDGEDGRAVVAASGRANSVNSGSSSSLTASGDARTSGSSSRSSPPAWRPARPALPRR
ncbi:hypothetical protein GTV15_12065 [Streptomyces sp. SID7803]|nr:hypothetical protein [Streptomyces sp. SID7803]